MRLKITYLLNANQHHYVELDAENFWTPEGWLRVHLKDGGMRYFSRRFLIDFEVIPDAV